VRAGVGAGLRFASPIGLIRLDLAYGKRGFVYLSLAGVY
jgi:outer membrane translocation and assembly module TamA